MKIILENEIEKKAWEIMLEAYHKWEKNHGQQLLDQVEWYFEDLYKDEVKEMIAEEVEARLIDMYGDDIEGIGILKVTEEEYVKAGLANYEGLTGDEIEQLKADLAEEYQGIKEDMLLDKEIFKEKVQDELRNIYYTFFISPEKLTVVYEENEVK